MQLLSCCGLSVGYDGKAVINNINFSVDKGDYICVVGENGAGKSTLMKTILGLQKPIEGKIIAGESYNNNEIGYLPQQTSLQKDFPASVWEIVLSGCLNSCGFRPFYSRAQKNIALANLEKLNIMSLKDKSYKELSGGQQQRVLLARALCATHNILLLDEPVSGLDPIASAEMYSIVEKLNKEDNITIIMISHDINEAIKYANKILHIGKSVCFYSKDDYINNYIANSGIGV